MSISRTVFLQQSKMIKPGGWAAAIRDSGFPVELGVDFDLRAFSGFLPCVYDGTAAGFEYFFQETRTMEIDGDLRRRIGNRDVGISFVTRSDPRGMATAAIAAAVLCKECDGVFLDEESGELLSPKEALAYAKEIEADLQRELDGPTTSPVAAAFRSAFEAEFLPLLQLIGFVRAKPARLRAGDVASFVVRPLHGTGRLSAVVWCNATTGDSLRFRLDLEGSPRDGQVPLEVPWPDPSYPGALGLDLGASQFLPREGPERLKMATAFLAGAFAANADRIADAVPEMAGPLREAKADPTWQSAVERARELWEKRHRRGDADDRVAIAKVVFVGRSLVTVEADGVRLTFQFDTSLFDRNLPVSVSGWYKTAAGTPAASRLTNGSTSWNFDDRGKLA